MTNKDGTKNDHKRGIDDPTKETNVQMAIGGPEDGSSEDGVREQSWGWTRLGEPGVQGVGQGPGRGPAECG